MEKVLEGVKVVDLSQWAFVPSAGAVLADWGADVIKVEHASRADPMRGLIPGTTEGYNFYIEQMNRNKRAIGLDVRHPDGRALFLDMIKQADVFLTSLLETARETMQITYEDLRKVNPRLIYARGTGQGTKGPDARKPGFDAVSYWARGGIGYVLTGAPGSPFVRQRGAFGDSTGGMFLAGGIAAALFRREQTGEGMLVDVSLMGTAAWILAPDLLSSYVTGKNPEEQTAAAGPSGNPLVGPYSTKDDRIIWFNMLEADRYWPGTCRALGLESLIEDARYATFKDRVDNTASLTQAMTDAMAQKTLEEWSDPLTENNCIWSAVQSPLEVAADPQTVANGFMPDHPGFSNAKLTASPVQFNGEAPEMHSGAPDHGQHTDEVLQEFGLDYDAIIQLKVDGVIN